MANLEHENTFFVLQYGQNKSLQLNSSLPINFESIYYYAIKIFTHFSVYVHKKETCQTIREAGEKCRAHFAIIGQPKPSEE